VASTTAKNGKPRRADSEVLTVSVARLLDDFGAPSVIDYLSLDIEGAEWWAFSTFPWHRYKFLTITIERPKPELLNKLVEVRSPYEPCTTFGNLSPYLS
jgi:hypothetical protein